MRTCVELLLEDALDGGGVDDGFEGFDGHCAFD